MSQRFVRDTLGWGFGLWLFGYVLGILLFPFVPVSIIGWVITPVGILVTLWVLLKKVKGNTLVYYLSIGTVWALIAIVCDYFFLVKVFKPADGRLTRSRSAGAWNGKDDGWKRKIGHRFFEMQKAGCPSIRRYGDCVHENDPPHPAHGLA